MPIDLTPDPEPNPDFDVLVDRLRQLAEDRLPGDSAIIKQEYYIAKYRPTGHTIRIWSAADEDWLPVELLTFGWSWVCVDAGNGPLWVMKVEEQIHPASP